MGCGYAKLASAITASSLEVAGVSSLFSMKSARYPKRRCDPFLGSPKNRIAAA